MKTIRRLLTCIILCAASIATPGCSTTGINGPAAAVATPNAVKTAATLATSTALSLGVTNATQRTTVAGECYAAAHALRTLSTGSAPTVNQVQDTIKQFGGPTLNPAYAALAGNLAAVYASFAPALIAKGDGAQVAAYLEALAEGVEDGAAPYLIVTVASIPIIDPPGTGNVLSVNAWEVTPEGRRLLGKDAGVQFALFHP